MVLISRLVLALVFGIAGTSKLADRPGTQSALEGFEVPPGVAAKCAVALPLFELAIAVSLLIPAAAWWAALAAAGLLLAFIGAIGLSLSRGEEPDCHCFGQLHSAPAGWRTLGRNIALLALSLVAVIDGPAEMTTPIGWLGHLSTAELVLGLTAVLFMAIACAQAFILLQLFRQHGRMISRIERLEATRGTDRLGILPSGNGNQGGLPLGSPAPEFRLPSLQGVPTSLTELRSRGRAILLVFSDPDCAACAALLPHLATWQHGGSQQLTVTLISRGEVERNAAHAQEHGIREVLSQADQEVAVSYGARMTPSAVLVSADGRIASPVVLGPDAIRALAESASAESTAPEVGTEWSDLEGEESAPHRPAAGLSIGTEAPDLEWRDLDGGLVSLRQLRGRPVTMIFWDPQCGFCRRLAPELRAWRRSHEDRQMIVISNGTDEENRELALDCTVLTETGFQTGALFGVGGTPSGIALDSEGKVAAPAAVGGVALMDLLDSRVGSQVTV